LGIIVELFELDGGADAGDDVLALGVHEELAVEFFFAGARVSREADAGAAVGAHVAEDHCLDVDGGAEQAGDVVELAIADGAVGHPGAEDGVDGVLELDAAVLREELADVLAVNGFVFFDDIAQLVGS